jgi:integral membrane protein
MNNKIFLRIFRLVAILEGISYLLILVVAYIFKIHEWVRPIGMAHGFLFIGYVILTLLGKMIERWSIKDTLIIFLASLIPFGTFYVEKKYLKN